MPQVLQLSGDWELAGFDGYGERVDARTLPAGLPNFLWIPATVPGSVYRDLERAVWLGSVNEGCNSLAAQWVERHYWFYRKRFEWPAGEASSWALVLDGLDLDALVFLNGRLVGEHRNFFRPARFDVTAALRPGKNELLIRLDAGLIGAADKRGGDFNLEVTAVESKRAHLRKPQFGARWDWAPRLLNVGIGGGVRLEGFSAGWVEDLAVTPHLAEESSGFRVRAHVVVSAAAGSRLEIEARHVADGESVRREYAAGAGTHCLDVFLPISDVRLWWPRPVGAPHLYELEITVRAATEVLAQRRLRTGLRTVKIEQKPDREGISFVLKVNGEPVFCRGANWVPPNLLYTTCTADDYRRLVDLAVEANFNLLRIWGGGLYADEALMEACDAAGVLVWHDMIFACSKYPADDPAFRGEAEAEVRHQVRRLSRHPSLAVWCGNNEIELGVADGWIASYDLSYRPDRAFFFENLAEIVAKEDGSRPYWPTSPWSPDGRKPNAPASGDQHPWFVSLGAAKGDYWAYRADTSRFPNEGGMLGPSTPRTLESILPESERHVGSRTWRHHDNTQNTWRGEPLLDHLLRINFADPQALGFADYVRYAGILHGEALETAIDTWRARKFASAAAIFWMFNDTWPAVVSWTPIDYFRRRKPAFWYVKRAFADQRVICVETRGQVEFRVVNDMPQTAERRVRWGLFAMHGGRPIEQESSVTAAANAVTTVGTIPLSEWDRLGRDAHGAFAILADERGTISQHRLFRTRFRELRLAAPQVQCERDAGQLRLRSDAFAWAVCLDDAGEKPLADNYFDLLPGIEYAVAWPDGWPVPTITWANPARHLA